jgi:hypothetical protein
VQCAMSSTPFILNIASHAQQAWAHTCFQNKLQKNSVTQ